LRKAETKQWHPGILTFFDNSAITWENAMVLSMEVSMVGLSRSGRNDYAKIHTSEQNQGRRLAMATSSLGKLIVIDDEAADNIIAAIEDQEANPKPYARRKILWGDPNELAETLHREYAREQ
jgi:hypothetical protein